MKKYEEIRRNYTPIYGSWDLEKFRARPASPGGGRAPGPRERLGFFPSPPDIFSKGHFPNVTSSREGVAKYQLGGVGENKDMKHVNMKEMCRKYL